MNFKSQLALENFEISLYKILISKVVSPKKGLLFGPKTIAQKFRCLCGYLKLL